MNAETERVRKERDFYRSLLELDSQDELEPLLATALQLVVATTGARLGYIAIGEDSRQWSIADGGDEYEIELIHEVVSRGIIAESLASGELIQTPSALLDPRFSARGSVRDRRIEAVICAPISGRAPGVVYLQGRPDQGPFVASDVELIERFARHLGPLTDRLLHRAEVEAASDPTRPWRERIKADRLVGRSEGMARLLRQVHQATLVDIDVLLDGPTGSGKTLVAEVIAANSARAGAPFIALNCAALPEALIESELFGAESGAHSTASKPVLGKVAAADGGTLFLDEVVELPAAAQAKLLQFLQSRSFFPLGASRARHVDVRIIAASNQRLSEAVEDRRFRADLMHRLSVFSISVPGLSERVEDIPELARAACAASVDRHGLGDIRLGAQAIAELTRNRWPGHVRQLYHTVEAGVVRAFGEGVSTVHLHHLFPERPEPGASPSETWHEATVRFQVEFLRAALDERDWNIAQTARDLDLARSHIYKLMAQYKIRR